MTVALNPDVHPPLLESCPALRGIRWCSLYLRKEVGLNQKAVQEQRGPLFQFRSSVVRFWSFNFLMICGPVTLNLLFPGAIYVHVPFSERQKVKKTEFFSKNNFEIVMQIALVDKSPGLRMREQAAAQNHGNFSKWLQLLRGSTIELSATTASPPFNSPKLSCQRQPLAFRSHAVLPPPPLGKVPPYPHPRGSVDYHPLIISTAITVNNFGSSVKKNRMGQVFIYPVLNAKLW